MAELVRPGAVVCPVPGVASQNGNRSRTAGAVARRPWQAAGG